MNIKDSFNEKTVFSLEVFPPHSNTEQKQLLSSLTGSEPIKPDFISITTGTNPTQTNASLELAKQIQITTKISTMPHLSGLHHSKNDIISSLQKLKHDGITNLLALRGDPILNQTPQGDFQHASQLVDFINRHGNFNIAGACYPQKHPEAINFNEDLLHLKEKINRGVSQLITQTLFDNQAFYDFRNHLQSENIMLPIEVGIMPCLNRTQINRITDLTGIKMPSKLVTLMDHYQNNPAAMRAVGLEYAINQIDDLVANQVAGIHLYTMNNIKNAQLIWKATQPLFKKSSHQPSKNV